MSVTEKYLFSAKATLRVIVIWDRKDNMFICIEHIITLYNCNYQPIHISLCSFNCQLIKNKVWIQPRQLKKWYRHYFICLSVCSNNVLYIPKYHFKWLTRCPKTFKPSEDWLLIEVTRAISWGCDRKEQNYSLCETNFKAWQLQRTPQIETSYEHKSFFLLIKIS